MSAEQFLGTAGVARRPVDAPESERASRAWWDADAAGAGARPVALDLSGQMLRHGAAIGAATGVRVPLVQAGAEHLPFAAGSFDVACSAFGAVPFVAEPDRVMREVARVLRPGGRWVFAVNHPMRWVFSDDPGPDGLVVTQSYFDRTPYVEV